MSYLTRIDHNVDRVIRMTNMLLDLSRIESGQMPVQLERGLYERGHHPCSPRLKAARGKKGHFGASRGSGRRAGESRPA